MKVKDGLELLFDGKFIFVSSYVKNAGGWTLYERFGDNNNSLIWEFFPENTPLGLSKKEIFHNGNLTEYYEGHPAQTTEFAYDHENRMLYVDRSDYTPGGFCNICVDEMYRVEPIAGTGYWLYDMEDVKNEPADYNYRTKVRKIKTQ